MAVLVSVCAVAMCWVARRHDLPYPVALVVGGGLLGFVPAMPPLALDPELVLALFLPPLLYRTAMLTSWRDFTASLGPISLLAIGLVAATTLALGAALKFLIPDIPWAVAFA